MVTEDLFLRLYSTSNETHISTYSFRLFREACNVLKHIFTTLVLLDQDCFQSEQGSEKLLQWIRDEAADTLRDRWSNDPNRTSIDKWEDVKAIAGSRKDNRRGMTLVNPTEIIFK